MDVDIDNFHQARQLIAKHDLINRSKCISYDLEFTGLRFQKGDRERPQHLPFERYKKMKDVVCKYNIIQFGITFITHEKDGTSLAYPFNFYLFPRENSLRDPIISLQGNTTEFNSNQGMDWNRWIKKGIPYVKMSDIPLIQTIKSNNKTFDEIMETADHYVIQQVKQIIKRGKDLSPNSLTSTLQIPKSSSYYIKKAIDRFTQTQSFTMKFIPALNPSSETITVELKYISVAQRQALKERKLEETYGFTLIFQQIWAKGKTFVGHNCLFDLLYIYENLVAPLPDNLMVFKEELRKGSNTFYDTKIVTNLIQNRNELFPNGTSLEIIYTHLIKHEKFLIQSAKMNLAVGFSRYDLEKPILHQAGFDGYLTGWIFYQLMKKFPQHYQQCKGTINIFRSYFQLNIEKSDTILPDTIVFVAIVFPPSKFVQKEEVWKNKQEMNKQLKDCFRQVNIDHYTQCHDGFKQIYIEIKDKSKAKDVASKLVKLVDQKKLPLVHSLAHFIEIKGKHMLLDKNNS